MKERRQFIKELGIGALSGFALVSMARAQGYTPQKPDFGTGKKVRVGIIGAENSHTVGFGNIFNKEKKFPGVEVVAVWGETDEFAAKAAQAGGIPKIVKKQEELLGMIDALIIDHRHPKYHAQAAVPFIQARIPAFVDKPFTYRVDEARELLELAEKCKTPITCLSSVGCGPGPEDMAAQVKELGELTSIVVTGPAEIDSKYGGIFFYGVHIVEQLFKVFGDDARAVRATRQGKRTTFQIEFESGNLATAIISKEREVYCVTDKGMVQIKSEYEKDNEIYMYAAIVKMFQTGEEPRTHASIIKAIATLEAMERSVLTEEWEFLVI